MSKLTLKEKQMLNDAVTGETKRCLALLKKHLKVSEYKIVAKDLIEGSPYIEFHPELLKRIPK